LAQKITRIRVPYWSQLWSYFRYQKNFQKQIREAKLGRGGSERAKQTLEDVRLRKKAMHDGSLTEEWVRKLTASQNKNIDKLKNAHGM